MSYHGISTELTTWAVSILVYKSHTSEIYKDEVLFTGHTILPYLVNVMYVFSYADKKMYHFKKNDKTV